MLKHMRDNDDIGTAAWERKGFDIFYATGQRLLQVGADIRSGLAGADMAFDHRFRRKMHHALAGKEMPLAIGEGKLWLPEPAPWTLDVVTGEAVISEPAAPKGNDDQP